MRRAPPWSDFLLTRPTGVSSSGLVAAAGLLAVAESVPRDTTRLWPGRRVCEDALESEARRNGTSCVRMKTRWIGIVHELASAQCRVGRDKGENLIRLFV